MPPLEAAGLAAQEGLRIYTHRGRGRAPERYVRHERRQRRPRRGHLEGDRQGGPAVSSSAPPMRMPCRQSIAG